MYTPKLNLMHDRDEAITFMRRFSFATIVTSNNGRPSATHLPFVISSEDGQIILTSHFAKANPQWQHLEQGAALVIFAEPHAYISPSHYEKELNVPTWNYLAVHAYGQGVLQTDPEQMFQTLESTIATYDSSYKAQWDRFPEDYKRGMANGIVAFSIVVTELEGKKKLSQNKTEREKQNIVDAFTRSADQNERMIAEYMKNEQVK